jgi:hypothetical protein
MYHAVANYVNPLLMKDAFACYKALRQQAQQVDNIK